MNDIQVVLIDADEETRVARRIGLRSQPGIEVASEATNGTTGLVLLESIDVDVALLDANLPDMSIAEFTQQMRELQMDAGVTISKLVILVDPRDPGSLLDVWAVKPQGYCRRAISIEPLAEAIHHVYTTGTYLDPAIAERLPQSAERLNPELLPEFNQIRALI